MTQSVHLIVGSTGAGKTTYARKLAAERRALVFSIDEWMQDLFGPDLAGADFAAINERVGRVRRQMWAVAELAGRLGVTSILDIGLLTPDARAQARTEAARRGFVAHTHYLDAPPETRWARISARNAARNAVYAFEVTRPMFDFVETIWIAPDADEQAEANFARVDAG